MPRTPLYVVYRTIRSTMQATGLSFSAAKAQRLQTLSRSETGRGILERESARRERARERRHEQRQQRREGESLARWRMRGFPDPDYSRDYGPTSPYAVVFKLTWTRAIQNPVTGQWRTEWKTTYATEIFHQFPTTDQIEKIINQWFDANAQDRELFDGPMGESELPADDWDLYDVEVVAFYISTAQSDAAD